MFRKAFFRTLLFVSIAFLLAACAGGIRELRVTKTGEESIPQYDAINAVLEKAANRVGQIPNPPDTTLDRHYSAWVEIAGTDRMILHIFEQDQWGGYISLKSKPIRLWKGFEESALFEMKLIDSKLLIEVFFTEQTNYGFEFHLRKKIFFDVKNE